MHELLEADRRLALAGTYNVRHVGGYRTAAGPILVDRLVWRGDALHALNDDGRRTLTELGMRTIVDLREDAEREQRPNLVDGVGARSVALSFYGGGRPDLGDQWPAMRAGDLTGLYRRMVADHGTQIAAAIGELATPGALPALVHCSAGKDRTGIVVALLLSALGVSDDDVLADFALTERYIDDTFVASLRAVSATPDGDREAGEMHERVFRGADPVWMRAALTDMRDRHGDAATYLVDHGLQPEALAALEAALTASTPDPMEIHRA